MSGPCDSENTTQIYDNCSVTGSGEVKKATYHSRTETDDEH